MRAAARSLAGGALLVATSAGGILCASTPPRQHPAPAADTDPAEVFRTRCASCHAVPDPNRATDAAWLGQIPETA